MPPTVDQPNPINQLERAIAAVQDDLVQSRRLTAALEAVLADLQNVLALLKKEPVPSDLLLKVKQGDSDMQNVVVKMGPKPKPGTKGAVMPPVQLTGTGPWTITFQVVDQNGNPISPPVDPTAVTTTLTSSDPQLTVADGADDLHYSGSLAANPTGSTELAATLAYNSGTPGPFTSSCQLLYPVPPPGVPTDLNLLIS